jgi:hypothetical protein
VVDVPAATGTTFTPLPPENATGNFTKIVQRLPVKIIVAPDQPLAKLLRVGMSSKRPSIPGLPMLWLPIVTQGSGCDLRFAPKPLHRADNPACHMKWRAPMNVQDQPHVKMTERLPLALTRRPMQDGPVPERRADAPAPYQGFDGQYINGSGPSGRHGGVQIDTNTGIDRLGDIRLPPAALCVRRPAHKSDFIQKR